jgi:hypothetical protein
MSAVPRCCSVVARPAGLLGAGVQDRPSNKMDRRALFGPVSAAQAGHGSVASVLVTDHCERDRQRGGLCTSRPMRWDTT